MCLPILQKLKDKLLYTLNQISNKISPFSYGTF